MLVSQSSVCLLLCVLLNICVCVCVLHYVKDHVVI